MSDETQYRVTGEMIIVTAPGGFLPGQNGMGAFNLMKGALLPAGVPDKQLHHLLSNNMIEPVEAAPAVPAEA